MEHLKNKVEEQYVYRIDHNYLKTLIEDINLEQEKYYQDIVQRKKTKNYAMLDSKSDVKVALAVD